MPAPPYRSSDPLMPDVPGVRHRDVEVAGVRLHVAEAGPADGGGQPPILMLHGWPQHWYCWRGVIGPLAEDRRVICPDLRGFGWSGAPEGDYAKQTLVDDVLGLLDVLEIDRVDLIAHDWGAWVGFLIALGDPDRIDHYLVLNMLTPWPDPLSLRGLLGLWRIWYQVLMATVGATLQERTDIVERVVGTGAVHPEAFPPDALRSYRDTLRRPANARASSRLYRTFLTRELKPFVDGQHRGTRLTVPTLLLFGTQDVAMDSRRLGEWERYADDMAVERHDDSGHFFAEELPHVVVDRARALFSGGRPADIAAGMHTAA